MARREVLRSTVQPFVMMPAMPVPMSQNPTAAATIHTMMRVFVICGGVPPEDVPPEGVPCGFSSAMPRTYPAELPKTCTTSEDLHPTQRWGEAAAPPHLLH